MDIKKAVVIGSNSFFGSHLVDYLLDNTDWQVIGISRSPEPAKVLLPYLYKKRRSPRFSFYQLNLNYDLPKIIKLVDQKKPEVIINFAAQSNVDHSWTNPQEWFMTNCISLVNLVNLLRERSYLKKFIQISTPEVYGPCEDLRETSNFFNPASPYGASKAAGDLFLLAMANQGGFPVSFVRASNIYGPHQQPYRIIPYSIIQLKNGSKIRLKSPQIQRDFIYIKDAVAGIYQSILKGQTGAVYHLASGSVTSILKLAKTICLRSGLKQPNQWIEIVPKIKRVKRDALYGLNFVQTKKILGWKPKISLEQGLDETISWVNESWQNLKNHPLQYIHKK